MKVSAINKSNYPQSTFKSLKLSQGLEYILPEKAGIFEINRIFEAGRKLENTQFFDLQMFDDMSFRIKEKGNVFSGLIEPIKIYRHSDKEIKVIGVYDGVEDGIHKKGEHANILLKYDRPESVDRIYNEIRFTKGITRLAAITKLLDDFYVKTKIEQNPTPLKKWDIVKVLMSKYGDMLVKK